jgi:hypothetical protein
MRRAGTSQQHITSLTGKSYNSAFCPQRQISAGLVAAPPALAPAFIASISARKGTSFQKG